MPCVAAIISIFGSGIVKNSTVSMRAFFARRLILANASVGMHWYIRRMYAILCCFSHLQLSVQICCCAKHFNYLRLCTPGSVINENRYQLWLRRSNHWVCRSQQSGSPMKVRRAWSNRDTDRSWRAASHTSERNAVPREQPRETSVRLRWRIRGRPSILDSKGVPHPCRHRLIASQASAPGISLAFDHPNDLQCVI